MRTGKRYGDWNIVDGIYQDGLKDSISGFFMG